MLLPQRPSVRRKLCGAGTPNRPPAAGEMGRDTRAQDRALWLSALTLRLPLPCAPAGPALELPCWLLPAPSQGPAPAGASVELAAP